MIASLRLPVMGSASGCKGFMKILNIHGLRVRNIHGLPVLNIHGLRDATRTGRVRVLRSAGRLSRSACESELRRGAGGAGQLEILGRQVITVPDSDRFTVAWGFPGFGGTGPGLRPGLGTGPGLRLQRRPGCAASSSTAG